MTEPAISYWAMHRRLAVLRGPASRQRCGCGAAAVGWCYDGTDSCELREPVRGRLYCLDPTRYQARCRSCRRQAIVEHLPPSDARAAAMVARYRAGGTLAGIADEFGVGRAAVRATLVASGVAIRPPRSQTAVAVDAERAAHLYEAGVSLRGVATVLGVSVPTARAAVTGAGPTSVHPAVAAAVPIPSLQPRPRPGCRRPGCRRSGQRQRTCRHRASPSDRCPPSADKHPDDLHRHHDHEPLRHDDTPSSINRSTATATATSTTKRRERTTASVIPRPELQAR